MSALMTVKPQQIQGREPTTTEVAGILAGSGLFKDVADASKALAKIMLGRSMGLDPVSSLMGIILVQGKPTLTANLMARCIQASGKYRYVPVEISEKRCALKLLYRDVATGGKWEEVGVSEFTMDDAKKAQLTSNPTWTKFPRNMLFARAVSNLARWYCPEVFGGAPVYLPDEIPGSGVVIDGETLEVKDAPQEADVRAKLKTLIESTGSDSAAIAKLHGSETIDAMSSEAILAAVEKLELKASIQTK